MDRRITFLKNEILSNLQDDWTVERMAHTVNVSPGHLRNIFNAEINLPPSVFLRKIRLEKACELLKESFKSIKEISNEVGIPDQSHFVRYFKEAYGSTPSEYRQRNDTVYDLANE